MNPYIVTTKRGNPPFPNNAAILSRCAVVTLDEARDAVWEILTRHRKPGDNAIAWAGRAFEGGKVTATLPDETVVIEVEATTWADVAREAGIDPAVRNRAVNGDTAMQQRILDAYNAREAA